MESNRPYIGYYIAFPILPVLPILPIQPIAYCLLPIAAVAGEVRASGEARTLALDGGQEGGQLKRFAVSNR